MNPRPPGHIPKFGLVFFVLRTLQGIARQWSPEKFVILTLKPCSHVRILIYWNVGYLKIISRVHVGYEMTPPDFFLLEQTRKDKGLPFFTCHTSIKTVNARTDWMNEKSKHYSDEHF